MSNRQQANRLILQAISKQIEASPDLCFGQILVNLDVVELRQTHRSPADWIFMASDPFYEESAVTLARVEKKVQP